MKRYKKEIILGALIIFAIFATYKFSWWMLKFRYNTIEVASLSTSQAYQYLRVVPGRFLRNWLLLGPIVIEADGAGELTTEDLKERAFDRDFLTRAGGESSASLAEEESIQVDGKTLDWESHIPVGQPAADKREVDLGAIYGVKNSVIYALAEVQASKTGARFAAIGTDGAVKLWVNGKQVLSSGAARWLTKDDDIVRVNLRKGRNQILLKLVSMKKKWRFAFRFVEPSAALFASAITGKKETAAMLLEERVPAGVRDHTRQTPLHQAAYYGRREVAELLLREGADVNASSIDGLTPLHMAQRSGATEMAGFLVEQGADPDSLPAEKSLQVDALCSSFSVEGRPGVAVMVIQKGRIVHSKGYGSPRLNRKVSITPQTPMAINSIAKQFTAVAILLLKDRGKLKLSDPLTKYIPEYPSYGDEITISHLLNHTSGAPNWIATRNQAYPITKEDFLKALKVRNERTVAPGEMNDYAQLNYILLSLIVERVSGLEFHEFMASEIFAPLGMERTVVLSPGMKEIPGRAIGYVEDSDNYMPCDLYHHMHNQGAGDIVSTLEDFALWYEALFGNRILKQETVAEMTSPKKLRNGKASSWGYGWQVLNWRGIKWWTHSGMSRGFKSIVSHYPERDLTIVVLSNAGRLDASTLEGRIELVYLADELGPKFGKNGMRVGNEPPLKAMWTMVEECERGVALSCELMGNRHEFGISATKDSETAISYYAKACDGGNIVGCRRAGLVCLGLDDTNATKKRAAGFFRIGCARKDERSCKKLKAIGLPMVEEKTPVP